MFRIDTLNAQPNENGAGKSGFSDNATISGMDATYLSPDWCNAVQEEIANLIEAAGVDLTKGTNNQLLTAVQNLIATAKTQAGQAANSYTDTEINALTTALDQVIANETTARQQADSSEANTRYNEDQALQAQITALQGKVGNVGSTDLQTQVNNITNTVTYPKIIAAGLLVMDGTTTSSTTSVPSQAGASNTSTNDSGSNTTWTGTVPAAAYGGVDLTNHAKYILQPMFLGLGHLPDYPSTTLAWETSLTSSDFTCSCCINDSSTTVSANTGSVAWTVLQLKA